jgi:hypothetical protein
MGGMGSGGWQRRHVTIEGCQSLTINLNQILRGAPAVTFARSLTFSTAEGRPTVTVRIERDAATGTGTAALAFNIQHWNGGTGPQVQRMQLRGDPRPFGGRHWYFICPATGARAAKLYLPAGGKRFLSRGAYGLRYRVQQERAPARAHRAIQNIDRRLGHVGGLEWQVEKPPGMWWRTFGRLLDRREAALAVLDDDIMAWLDRVAGQEPAARLT